ncbi:MAG TPA: zinc-binding dehydrogenase [Solimonas sp.]|nr:zinc-binding dehydrogenase [Solimonas sp.]
MRAIYIERPGPADQAFALREVPVKPPGPAEVAIRVRAAGINFADVLARQGIYPDAPKFPCVVGYEVAGTVEAVGTGIDKAWLGKEVLALTDFGGYAEVANCDAHYVWTKPTGMSFETAAAIPLNYITAWGLLVAMGGLAQGDSVLIHNAGGGVGLAALDIALHRGAFVIGTASARKHEFLKARGLHHAVDYTRPDWPAQVLQLTGGQGVELAIDPIGGKNWAQTYSVLRPTGRIGMFGISSAAVGGFKAKLELLKLALAAPFFHPLKLIPGNRGAFGINIHSMYEQHGKFNAWMAEILRGAAQGWVRPHVDKVYKFEQVGEAHAYIEGRGNIGKVLLVP